MSWWSNIKTQELKTKHERVKNPEHLQLAQAVASFHQTTFFKRFYPSFLWSHSFNSLVSNANEYWLRVKRTQRSCFKEQKSDVITPIMNTYQSTILHDITLQQVVSIPRTQGFTLLSVCLTDAICSGISPEKRQTLSHWNMKSHLNVYDEMPIKMKQNFKNYTFLNHEMTRILSYN